MYEARRIIGVAGLAAAVLAGAILCSTMLPRGVLAAPAADKTTTSPKIRALMTSLAQEWLAEQGVANAAAVTPAHETHSNL